MRKRKPIQRTEEEFERRHVLVMNAIEKHHTYLTAYMSGLCKNHHTAEDLMQELWIYVLNSFQEDLISCLPILRRKAWQIFCDYYRKQKRKKVIVMEHLPEVPITNAHEAEPVTQEEEQALEKFFWEEFPNIELSEKQKQVLWLYARYKHSYRVIKDMTGVPTSTIGDWIEFARTKIADYINNEN